jgi:hypothetical protein
MSMDNHENFRRGSWICWKSVLGGVFVASLAYMILSSLGAGIGGLTASHMIEKGENSSGFGTVAGLWLGASAIISVFLGSYFSTRFSDVDHKQVAACQSIVISAIFFYLLINVANASFSSFSELAANISTSKAVSEADLAAKTVGETGWILFLTLILGVIAGIIGGIEGVVGNLRRPFQKHAA